METLPSRFPDLFFSQVEKYGDRVALRHKKLGIWNRISWREYGQRVRTVSAALMSYGLKIGDRISILGDNCPEWIICHIGAMSCGCVTCGIYPTSSADEINYVVSHSESKILFLENEEQMDKVLEIIDTLEHVEQVVVWDEKGLFGFSHERVIFFGEFMERGRTFMAEQPGAADKQLAAISPDETAMIIYTSGTTGRPKGAMLSHKNILAITAAFIHVIESSEDDEMLSYLPLAHIYENLISVFQAVWSGGTVNFVESLDTLALNLREVSPTVFASVPRIWEKFVSMIEIKMSDSTWLKRKMYRVAINVGRKWVRTKSNGGTTLLWSLAYWPLYFGVLYHLKRQVGLERIRYAVCGAAPAGSELFEFWNAMGVPLREGYGQTESTGVIALQRLAVMPRPGYVGEVLPGVDVKIADDGEILAKGDGVFKGYFKDPKLTAETVVDGWLHTGDVGALENGWLKIMDRKKDIIITQGGKNITPAYIENKLKFSFYIQDAVVIGDARKYLTALILIDEDNVTKYAQDNRIPFTTFADLTRNPDIVKLIENEVKNVNKDLARVETVKKFQLLPRRFYAEDGDVTPTQKVKRSALAKTYGHLIEEMYKE
jgi:long-chain acyl-CoA synthetase